jgi:hypothetical protein
MTLKICKLLFRKHRPLSAVFLSTVNPQGKMESNAAVFVPPEKIEALFPNAEGNKFASINKPTAGPQRTQDLPRGTAPFQLYSLATPNGQKVGIMLEELGIEYDAHGEITLSAATLHFLISLQW